MITGYREMTLNEVAAINTLKEAEQKALSAIMESRTTSNFDPRWSAIAYTHIQEGFMAAVRSIARPGE